MHAFENIMHFSKTVDLVHHLCLLNKPQLTCFEISTTNIAIVGQYRVDIVSKLKLNITASVNATSSGCRPESVDVLATLIDFFQQQAVQYTCSAILLCAGG